MSLSKKEEEKEKKKKRRKKEKKRGGGRLKGKAKTKEYNIHCTGSLTMQPKNIYLSCTHILAHDILTLGSIALLCLGQGQTYIFVTSN